MEYQKINNLLGVNDGKVRKYNTVNWIEINDQSNNVYNENTAIKFNTPMLRTSLCDFSDAYIVLDGRVTVTANATNANADAGIAAQTAQQNRENKNFIFKNCAPFTNCIIKINATTVEQTNDIDLVMPMYNLIEYSDNYEKTSGSLWQFKRDEPNDNINDSESFKYKVKFTGQTGADGTKNVKIAVPLKYLSNFWRNLELPLIFCDVELELRWSENCILIDSNPGMTSVKFTVSGAKLYVPSVTLANSDNVELLKNLKSGFKREVEWNEYESKVVGVTPGPYINHLVSPSFQGVNRLFVLAYKDHEANDAKRNEYKKYYLPNQEIKDYNVLIDGKNFYDQPINDDVTKYNEIRKVATGRGDDYTTACLLDFAYFKDHYKLIAVDLSRQRALDEDPKAIQQINFKCKIEKINDADNNPRNLLFVTERSKKTVLEFSQNVNLKVL